jgi:hypothetical protein
MKSGLRLECSLLPLALAAIYAAEALPPSRAFAITGVFE